MSIFRFPGLLVPAIASSLCAAVLVTAIFARERVVGLMSRGLPGAAATVSGALPGLAVTDDHDEPMDTGGEYVDLEHPTEADWTFLLETLEHGKPEARRSAARVLLQLGGDRAVAPLFQQAGSREPDAAFFCLAALEILRLQKKEEAMVQLLLALQAEDLSLGCRAEVSDRFALLGGRDPEVIVGLARHEDERVRAFVGAFLVSSDPMRYADVIEELTRDGSELVRERVTAALGSTSSGFSR